AARLGEEDFFVWGSLAYIYLTLGREDEGKDAARRAVRCVEKEIGLHPDNAHAVVWGASSLIRLGMKERAKEWIERILIIEPDDAMIHYNVACDFALLNELDRALDTLESCADKIAATVVVNWLKNDNDLAPLFAHPRYQALIARAEARLAATAKQASEAG